MMAKNWEDAPLTRMNGHLQIRVRIEEHAFLQASGTQICKKNNQEIFLMNSGTSPNKRDTSFLLLILSAPERAQKVSDCCLYLVIFCSLDVWP